MAFIHAFGCVTVHGLGARPLLDAVERAAAGPVRTAPAGVSAPAAGWLEPALRPDLRLREQRLRFARTGRLSQIALLAVHDALADRAVSLAGPRVGVTLGTAFGAHLSNEQFFAGLLAEPLDDLQLDPGLQGASPRFFAQTLPSAAAAEVAIQLGLAGPLVALAQGRGAGLSALEAAASLVDTGRAEQAVTVAADTLGATLLAAVSAPGPLLAEAGTAMLLSPRARGALARVAGTCSSSGPEAGARAEAECLVRAGLAPADLACRCWVGPCRAASTAAPLAREPLDAAGDCLAARPLLAAILLLARPTPQLPALIGVEDPDAGTADALCLTCPRG